MIVQSELSGERIARELLELRADPNAVSEMEKAARALGREDAAGRTVDLIEELMRNV